MVSFLKTYQVIDSSEAEPVNVQDENGLELIEELDDQIAPPSFKKKYNYRHKQDTVKQRDVFYGIKNENDIPIRSVEIKTTKGAPIEKLFDPEPIVIVVSNWQIIILIGTILMLGFVKAFSSSRFKLSIKALFNYSVAQEITREEKVFFHRSNVLYTMIHLLTTSLFLYHLKEVINNSAIKESSFKSFILILGFLTVIYLTKYLFSKALFFILNSTSTASEYIFNVSLFNNLLGIILIPLLSLIYFSSLSFSFLLLYIAIPLIVLIFLFRLFRLYVMGNEKGISYFYIFLYICTLEILPLVVLYRIFIHK